MEEMLPYIQGLLDSTLSSFRYLLPEIILVITFLLVIITDLFSSGKRSSPAFFVCIVGILVSIVAGLDQLSDKDKMILFNNTVVIDKISSLFRIIFSLLTILFALFIRYNKALHLHTKGLGDLYMLLPAALIGLNLMSMSTSLLMIYVSIEMVSVASYLLVGYTSAKNTQTEAAMKYLLFGSVCSAIMLYGMSLLYAFTGTINLADPVFVERILTVPQPASTLAIVLVLVGIGFKMSFVPLHFWSPDVYEGAPTPVSAFLSTAPKIAGFAVLIRFLEPLRVFHQATGGNDNFNFTAVLSIIAILTMVVGNFSALLQNKAKRMLAYSSIGHTGFALMAIVSNKGGNYDSLIYYFVIYSMMNMAAFILVEKIEEHTGETDIRSYAGLGLVLKPEFASFVVVLIALTGLPPTAGFIAKLFIFSSAFEAYSLSGSVWIFSLMVVGALTTVISLFYYMKIPLFAYLRQSEVKSLNIPKRDLLSYFVFILAFILVLIGIFPDLLDIS